VRVVRPASLLVLCVVALGATARGDAQRRGSVAYRAPNVGVAKLLAGVRGVGLQTFDVRDPVSGKAMPGVVFYPTEARSGSTSIGPYVVGATAGEPPSMGRFPLIAFSHGTGGSRYDDPTLKRLWRDTDSSWPRLTMPVTTIATTAGSEPIVC